jgi:hypothetical protein
MSYWVFDRWSLGKAIIRKSQCMFLRRFYRCALYVYLFLVFVFFGSSSAIAEDKSQTESVRNSVQIGAWRADTKVDEAGKTRTILSLAGGQSYKGEEEQQKIPDLVLSCQPGNTIVYVDVKQRIRGQDDAKVNLYYSFDGEPPTLTAWQLNNGQFVVAPDPSDFIQQLSGKKRLEVEIRPYGRPTMSAYFALDNLELVFSLMTERCYQ